MILHLDMDAFFASVEQRDNPELQGKPLVVSGHSQRSVVSTASYEARTYGVHSAMPLFQALQLCPNLIVLQGNRHKYAQDSRRIMAILETFSPIVEPVSIDEAYMDIQGSQSLFGPPEQLACQIKERIFRELALTCSIGIAPVRFLAKIASDMNKPDGLTLILPDQVADLITRLPIGKVPGVGTQAMKQMAALNIRFLGDVQKFDTDLLIRKFGKMGGRLSELARGIDSTPMEPHTQRKSISSETTLDQDISDPAEIRHILLAHAQEVGRDLRRRRWTCRHVSIKVKFSDFTQITRSKKCALWISSSKAIFEESMALFSQVSVKKKIRLLGVGVSDFKDMDAPVQATLLPDPDETSEKQWKKVDLAVDSVWEKFGAGVLQKASLSSEKIVTDEKEKPWNKKQP